MKHYIYWKYKEQSIIDSDELHETLEALIETGAHKAVTKTVAEEWFAYDCTYSYEEKGSWEYLYIANKAEFGHDVYILKSNKYKLAEIYQQREELDFKPSDCREEIVSLFKKKTGVSLCKAFKPVSSDLFKNLVPKPIYYVNRSKLLKEITGVQYIDVSSMFPANARGRMPDAHTAIVYTNQRVEPNEEYPFAFYLNSHHCAELGVFDTRDYLKLDKKYYCWQNYHDKGKPIYNEVRDEDETTVLMKASKYELTDVFEEIYQRKLNGDELAKAIANVGIGTLHRNPENYGVTEMKDYYHLAAVILGRSNALQYAMIKKIEKNHGVMLQAIVDSLIYIGDENYGRDDKVLGTYYNEFHKTVNYRGANINKYVIYDDEKILKYVVSGVKKQLQEVDVPEDIDKYKEK